MFAEIGIELNQIGTELKQIGKKLNQKEIELIQKEREQNQCDLHERIVNFTIFLCRIGDKTNIQGISHNFHNSNRSDPSTSMMEIILLLQMLLQ